ncbi:MAG: FMN-binding protein [Spirochaetaceae bacterium]|nr:FMN-binding protein [Spirochaetaceae bacterium]
MNAVFFRKAGRSVAATAAALVVALLAAGCLFPTIEIGSVDLSSVRDGRWTGSFDGNLVKVEVAATIASSRIVSVEILRHDCGKGKPAESIVDAIVATQSLDVDTISGATYSSRCILKATELALIAGL